MLAGATPGGPRDDGDPGALGAAVGVVFVGHDADHAARGRNPDVGFGFGETVLYGASLVLPAAVFVGVGALTSQLGRSRRLATGRSA